jgi:hypothetical protein
MWTLLHSIIHIWSSPRAFATASAVEKLPVASASGNSPTSRSAAAIPWRKATSKSIPLTDQPSGNHASARARVGLPRADRSIESRQARHRRERLSGPFPFHRPSHPACRTRPAATDFITSDSKTFASPSASWLTYTQAFPVVCLPSPASSASASLRGSNDARIPPKSTDSRKIAA